jgi:hypothetical protein
MADNFTVNNTTQAGGPTMRWLARAVNLFTPVFQLDIGGASSNAESLVSLANPIPETAVARTVTTTVATITAGGTAQNVLSSITSPGRLCEIYNPRTATESLFVSDGGTATTNSIEIQPGGYYISASLTTNAISVLGATTAHAFTVVSR